MIAPRAWLLPVSVICLSAAVASAQVRQDAGVQEPVVRVAAALPGSIYGVVLDEAGSPVDGAVISALGGSTAFAVTDRAGQYHLTQLPPGPYVVRAHREGFAQVRSTLVNVRAAARAPSSFTLRRADVAPAVMAAGVGVVDGDAAVGSARRERSRVAAAPSEAQRAEGRDRPWRRLRRGRRRLALRGLDRVHRPRVRVVGPAGVVALHRLPARRSVQPADGHGLRRLRRVRRIRPAVRCGLLLGRRAGRPPWRLDGARRHEQRRRLVVDDGRRIHDPGARPQPSGGGRELQPPALRRRQFRGAPGRARRPSQGGVDLGQPRRRPDARAGSWDTAPATSTTTISTATAWSARRCGRCSRPLPACGSMPGRRASRSRPAPKSSCRPADAQWVPPQRTFAPIGDARFSTESVQHYELGATRQFSGLSVGVRAFRQVIDDQLVTVFGAADPARLVAAGGHYSVALAGDAQLQGWARAGRARAVAVRARQRRLRTGDHRVGRSRRGRTAGRWPSWRRARCARPTSGCTISRPRSKQRFRETATRIVALYKLNSGFAGDPHAAAERRRPLRHAAAPGAAVHELPSASGRCWSASGACSAPPSTTARSTTSCWSCVRPSG